MGHKNPLAASFLFVAKTKERFGMTGERKLSRKQRIFILFIFLLLNALYKRFIQHTSGPAYGNPNELIRIIPSVQVITMIDILMDVAGLVAFVWLIVEIIKGIVSRIRRRRSA